MKRLIFLVAAAFAVASCQKNPDFGKLSSDYLVYTVYKTGAFSAALNKVYVPNQVVEINSNGTRTLWSVADSAPIVSAYTTGLTGYGYTMTNDSTSVVNFRLNLTYTRNVTYFINYPPYWWWNYWSGGYWPSWYYPFPYPYVYGYSSVSLVGELVSLPVVTPATFPVVWNVYTGGNDFGSKTANNQYFVTAIARAFAQSPYLKIN